MLFALATRATMSVNVLHERNPLFTRLSNGSVRNDYTMRFLNKGTTDRDFMFTVKGLPQAVVRVIGVDPGPDGKQTIVVGPDQTREVRVLVSVSKAFLPAAPVDLTFMAVDLATGETSSVRDHFIPN